MNTISGNTVLEIKNVTISQKRQFTIPSRFFELLGFGKEAECMVRGNELIIRPATPSSGGEFAEQVLADLIAQGYQGDELLSLFKEGMVQVKKAINSMLSDAKSVAKGQSDYSSYDDIFGSEN